MAETEKDGVGAVNSVVETANSGAIPELAETPAAHRIAALRHDRESVRRLFETGEYPYKNKVRRKDYENHKAELQIELLKVQEWVRETGEKIVILFEGRDAA
ncbi:MAG: polyphosphate kinase 2, partial [Rhodobiaceae bacterium]|nr:polyphosphate kinase 2 [Rhodobiaceae bacterium]